MIHVSSLLLLGMLATADQQASDPEPTKALHFSAAYRFRSNAVTDLPVDFRGDRLGQGRFEEQRLRLSADARPVERLSLLGEVDLFSGLLSGDRADAVLASEETDRSRYAGRSRIDLRQLHADLLLPFGLVQIGQVAVHWGLGMLANDGRAGRNDFGDEYSGSLYDQFLFATKPFLPGGGRLKDVVTAIVASSVFRDPLADRVRGDEGNPRDWDLRSGDRAWQFGAVLFNDVEGRRIGLESVYRRQRFETGGNLKAVLADAFLDLHLPERGTFQPYVQAEAAGAMGTSTEFANVNALGGADVLQGGGVLRAGARRAGLDLSLEAGYASGDRNPFDKKVTSFVFHPDYNVGLILFDEVLSHFTAATASVLSDPALVGRAPGGIQLFPTDGGVTNALYGQIKARQRIWGPTGDAPNASGAHAILAALYARGDQPLLDPAAMTLGASGGSPANYLGASADSRDLGFEVDAGLRARLPFPHVTPECGLEAGYLLPGDAFTRPDGGRLDHAYKLRFLLSLSF